MGVPREFIGIGGDPHQGPHFVFHVTVTDGAIVAVRFKTFGCLWSNLIGLTTASLIENRPVAVCGELGESDILARTGQVPRSKEDLPGLACAALRGVHREAAAAGSGPG